MLGISLGAPLSSKIVPPGRINEASFVGALLHSGMPIRQASVAKMLGVSQSTISRYAQDYVAREGVANAQ